jgi:multiple sugar transport system substrate-binding protein
MNRRNAGPAAATARALLALLCCGATLSCSGQTLEDGETVVRFVTWRPNQPAVWERVYAEFAAAHPDIRLEREVGPHSSTAFHDLLTQKLKNRSTDVDVFLMDVIWPAEFAAAGWAAPLDDYFPDAERQRFFDGAVLANTWEGSVYGVPLYVGSGILYYRTDLLAEHGFEPPETWQELVEQARTIVAAQSTAASADGSAPAGRQDAPLQGFSAQFKQYEGLVCNMMEYIAGNGGSLLDAGAEQGAVSTPAAVEAVRFVRDEIVGAIAPQGVLTYEEPESIALFVQGGAVFHRNWPYAWQVANDPQQSRIAGNVGIAKLPHFGGGDSVSTLGGWQVGISRFSENPDAAWRFVEFLTSERIQKLFAVEAALAPTRRALYDDPDVLAAQPQLADMEAVFATAHPRPRTPLYPAVSNALQRYFSRAIADPDADIEGLAGEADADIARLLSLAR